jgi:hypothetical protein
VHVHISLIFYTLIGSITTVWFDEGALGSYSGVAWLPPNIKHEPASVRDWGLTEGVAWVKTLLYIRPIPRTFADWRCYGASLVLVFCVAHATNAGDIAADVERGIVVSLR